MDETVGFERVQRVISDSWDVVEKALGLVSVDDAISLLGGSRCRHDAIEATLLASRINAGATPRQVAALLSSDAKTSKKEAGRRVKRARAVHANPTLASNMQKGTMSGDHVDVIADAAEKTNGAAAVDEKLIADVAGVNPDQARRIAAKFVSKHTSNEGVQSEYDLGRRLRCVRRYESDQGTDVLHIEGASQDIDEIEASIRRIADQLYRADGGRDTPATEHPRTRDQRAFDAAKQLLTSDNSATSEHDSSNSPGRVSLPQVGRTATFFVTATIDQVAGVDESPTNWIGSGPLPRTMLEHLACNAEFIGQIYDQVGEVLWQGRAVRSATPAQIKALIARDESCVLCGAHYSTCQAHHLVPWNAPLEGKTDIDKLALVCSSCHTRIHEQALTLYRDSESRWKLRPAKPEEVAPDRPPKRRRPEQARASTTKPELHQRRRTGVRL